MAETAPTATVSVDLAQTQPDHVTLNVVASPAPSAAAANPTPQAAASAAAAANPAQSSAAASKPESTSTTGTTSSSSSSSSGNVFQRAPDDFYNTIFYFSGMGSVIGSALAEGIYVNEKNRRNAVDSDVVENSTSTTAAAGPNAGRQQPQELVVTARGQAQTLSTEFHRLHALLDALPVYTGSAPPPPPVDRRRGGGGGELDQPIHGELYFRCKERFPVQPGSTGSRPHSRMSGGGGGATEYFGAPMTMAAAEEKPVRRRQQNDDAVLADATRAAVESFPLLPPPTRSSSSRGQSPSISMSPSPGPYHHQQPQPAAPSSSSSRRRRAPDRDGSAESSGLTGAPRPPSGSATASYADQSAVDGGPGVKSWQMSHVRQYDVSSGYPIANDRP